MRGQGKNTLIADLIEAARYANEAADRLMAHQETESCPAREMLAKAALEIRRIVVSITSSPAKEKDNV